MLERPLYLLPVTISLNTNQEADELANWLEEHMTHRFVFITGNGISDLIIAQSDMMETTKTGHVWAFENEQDAILFKLTWCGK